MGRPKKRKLQSESEDQDTNTSVSLTNGTSPSTLTKSTSSEGGSELERIGYDLCLQPPNDTIPNLASWGCDTNVDPKLLALGTESEEQTCACLANLYLSLEEVRKADNLPFMARLSLLRHLTATAVGIIQCQVCPTEFLWAMQNAQLLNTLIISVAEGYKKIVKSVEDETRRAQETNEAKLLFVSDGEKHDPIPQNGNASFDPLGLSLSLDPLDWQNIAKRAIKAEIFGSSYSIPTSFNGMLQLMEDRQQGWHSGRLPIRAALRIVGEAYERDGWVLLDEALLGMAGATVILTIALAHAAILLHKGFWQRALPQEPDSIDRIIDSDWFVPPRLERGQHDVQLTSQASCMALTVQLSHPYFGGYMMFESFDFYFKNCDMNGPWIAASVLGGFFRAAVFVMATLWWMKCQHFWSTDERGPAGSVSSGKFDPSTNVAKASFSGRSKTGPIVVDGTSFALNGKNVSYRLHVDTETGDLILDHFGGRVTEDPLTHGFSEGGGWTTQAHLRREFPDLGRGDFRSPAVSIKHEQGSVISDFRYKSHSVIDGKPALSGLPSTFGQDDEVATLVIHLWDSYSSVAADLSYSIFPNYDAIVRAVKITNEGNKTISVEKLASLSVDLPHGDYEMLQLQGEWSRECNRIRRRLEQGSQSFGSNTGYSSHFHNPFLSLVLPSTTESHGEAWGFSLVYSGSFKIEVEKSPQGLTRALVGMNPCQLSWPLKPGESLESPECVSVFSNSGIGHMSRTFHRLYRQNLIKSKFVNKPRPILLNSWEGLYFNYGETIIYSLAEEAAKLGAKLFVLDDGWFGDKHPRVDSYAGLGDWVVNRERFPNGLKELAEKVIALRAADTKENLQFGLWFEPEMVNKKSMLYEEHPEWALHAGDYPRTEARHQLVLNVALPEVQEFIVESVSKILEDVPITYIKWDANRGIHEISTPDNYHAYVLGMYHVFKELTSKFPDVLWEGCGSGGGRFDPGILQYFPQIWASDNTDALDRIHIQFGNSLVYPPSTMGAHVSAVPNDITGRTTPIRFRAHVAMMGGSFGLELNPAAIPEDDRAQIPDLLALAEKVNPIIVRGDMWRLNLPEDSNYPAALFISEDGDQAVLFVFQIRATTVHSFPIFRLQGLDASANYKVGDEGIYSGATLMNGGIQYRFGTDYDSKVVLLEKI
ncbi:hypothetical protein FZEAL_3870 [Fusarium zealandicum]|uniref:alpha-galactosidase n=1 Tax=Fusarium zealandicum TaxID=1053134 RepID=A0A8H4UNF6_9HYPO|nr:hypothetical protein FZEAL_3870 [Fusarium zealandicum]